MWFVMTSNCTIATSSDSLIFPARGTIGRTAIYEVACLRAPERSMVWGTCKSHPLIVSTGIPGPMSGGGVLCPLSVGGGGLCQGDTH